MMHVELVPLESTWRNGRSSLIGVSRRLDRLLVEKGLLESFDFHR
jgi:hypothetical protein